MGRGSTKLMLGDEDEDDFFGGEGVKHFFN